MPCRRTAIRRMFSVSHCFFLSLSIFEVAVGKPCTDCEIGNEISRNKRIVYGTPLRDFNSYDVMGYYVHISRASEWSWYWYKAAKTITFNIFGIAEEPGPGYQLCGGSLITPNIVQTACHCVCKGWTRPPNWGPAYVFPIMQNNWEDIMVLHHGYYRVSEFKDGVWSRKFIVHLECKAWNISRILTHDYGMIMTAKPLSERPWIRVNFAPVYTRDELARQYYRTMKREAVCLFIGFGKWNYVNKKKGLYGESSKELMHGWRSLRNYWECFYDRVLMDNPLYGHSILKDYHKRYYRDCTWSCHTFFGRHRELVAQGDSGSPVACSDEYFGLNSYSKGQLFKNTNRSVEVLAAVAFNMYENAAEYREAMIKRFYEFAESNKDYPPEVRDLATIDPFHPDSYYEQTVAPYWGG